MNSLAPVASPAGEAARLEVTEGATVDLPMKTQRLRFLRFFSCKTARYFTPPQCLFLLFFFIFLLS
ncbi:MAG: hypothetical protein J6Z13_02050 [Clostridia bacterium]|nr:hypothetical protein [Clostridia bacterium]